MSAAVPPRRVAPRRRGLLRRWRVRARHGLRRLLRIRESPERIALSFAVGVFIAFTPVLGTHTLLVLLAAFVFRLNFPLVLAGAFVNNPWTVVPMYAGALGLGLLLTGGAEGVPELEGIFAAGGGFLAVMGRILTEMRPFLVPFVVGCLLLGLVAAAVSYAGLLVLVRWARGRAARRSR